MELGGYRNTPRYFPSSFLEGEIPPPSAGRESGKRPSVVQEDTDKLGEDEEDPLAFHLPPTPRQLLLP